MGPAPEKGLDSAKNFQDGQRFSHFPEGNLGYLKWW